MSLCLEGLCEFYRVFGLKFIEVGIDYYRVFGHFVRLSDSIHHSPEFSLRIIRVGTAMEMSAF